MANEFRKEMAPYIDEDGLVLERQNSSDGPETGNGITNLSVYMLILHLSGNLKKKDVAKFCEVIRACEVSSYVDYPPDQVKGLYNRGPRKMGDLIGHDDYVSLAGVSAIIGAPFAKEIAQYGSSHFWSFNNVEPGKWTLQSFQGRHLDLVPFWNVCAGNSVSWAGRFLLSKSIAWSSGNASAMILKWIQCRALLGRMSQFDEAIDDWKHYLIKRYPMGMMSVFSEYYGPQHPFAKYGPIF